MLQTVTRVLDSALGKFQVEFECEHKVWCDARIDKRDTVKAGLVWTCPICATFNFEVGVMYELRVKFAEVPILGIYTGIVDGRFAFQFPEGDDTLVAREILSAQRI